MKRINILINDGLRSIVKKWAKEEGYESESACIRAMIRFYDANRIPAYLLKKKAKKDDDRPGVGICKILEGKIVEKDGHEYCHYIRYEELAGKQIEQYDTEESLSTLNDENINSQYITIDGTRGEEAKQKIKNILGTATDA